MLARSLEFTSVLDSLSLALGNAVSGKVAETEMSAVQALPILLQALDYLVLKLAPCLEGAYVNSLLVQRDALLKLSSLQNAFKSALRVAQVSPLSLFGPCAKAAVEESAKRTSEEAFAALARQGKRKQHFQQRPAKKPRASGSVSAGRDSRPFRPPSRPAWRGRGGRRPAHGAPSKQPSKGVYPQ
jgi:hypothetical protein